MSRELLEMTEFGPVHVSEAMGEFRRFLRRSVERYWLNESIDKAERKAAWRGLSQKERDQLTPIIEEMKNER